MRKLLGKIFGPPVAWLANRFSSAPDSTKVFKALSDLYTGIVQENDETEGLLYQWNARDARIIIFSDQHMGRRNGADDFRTNEATYLSALRYYLDEGFVFVNLGDSEELWENTILQVIRHNKSVHELESEFIQQQRYCKVYGNHDNLWHIDPLASAFLKQMFGRSIPVYAGVVMQLDVGDDRHIDIFCTHGHQGDDKSDGNWFSAAFVNYVWAPLQSFLGVNPNSPSNSTALKTLHNSMMYDWSAKAQGIVLITGHTHQPVFRSHTHLERLYIHLEDALANNDEVMADTIRQEIPRRMQQYDYVQAGFRDMKPSYFNTGCCCYSNGNITGIEMADGCIRLVKWSSITSEAIREVAEEMTLAALADAIHAEKKPKTTWAVNRGGKSGCYRAPPAFR